VGRDVRTTFSFGDATYPSSFFPRVFFNLNSSSLMAVPNRQRPVQQGKDQREWTTPEQKAHLVSKKGEYSKARDEKNLPAWLSVELQTYFDLFPTEPVTVKENMKNPGWTMEEKKLFEEKVSNSKLNRIRNTTHRSRANRGSEHGLKTIIVLQRRPRTGRGRSSSLRRNLKNSATRNISRKSFMRITRRQ
jgi:hypothetical protein